MFITLTVLMFQVCIFSTIVFFRKKRVLLAGCWAVFTLLGSIHTAGLMLLQLVTIWAAFSTAGKLISHQKTLLAVPSTVLVQPVYAPKFITSSESVKNDIHWYHWIVIAIIFGNFYAYATIGPVSGIDKILFFSGYAFSFSGVFAAIALIIYLVFRLLKMPGRHARIFTLILLILIYCIMLKNGIETSSLDGVGQKTKFTTIK